MFRPTNGTSVVVIVVVAVVALTTAGRETSGVSYHRLACPRSETSGVALLHLAFFFSLVFTIISPFSFISLLTSTSDKEMKKGRAVARSRLRKAFRTKKCQDIPRRSASRTILATAFKPVGHFGDASVQQNFLFAQIRVESLWL